MPRRSPSQRVWVQQLLASPHKVSFAVFFFALLVTGAFVAGLAMAIQRQERLTFENEVARSLDAIGQRITVTSSLLHGTAGLLRASDQVSAEEFRRYIAGLELRKRYPGILGIGFSRRVAPGEVRALEAQMRAAGRPEFRIWPGGPREAYHSIVYLEPLDRRNAEALGFDMYTEPVRRAAMSAARERGELVASGKVTLVQEIEARKQAGFLMYLPVYAPTAPDNSRGSLLGFVYAPLRTGDLLAGTRGSGEKLIDYQVFDDGRADPGSLLRSTVVGRRDAPPRLAVDREIVVAGRPWLIRFQSTPELEAQSLRWLVPWLALAALLSSALLARVSWLQARARTTAESFARDRQQTAQALHREREWLAATLGSIGDAVIAVDADHRVTWMNVVAERLTGWPRSEALGHPLDEVAPSRAMDDQEATASAATGRGQAMLRSRDGIQRPVEENSAPIRDASGTVTGAVIVLRDASERYRVEGDLRENDRRKDEFLAMLAHELRNPLAPISTASHVLKLSGADPRRVRDAGEVISRQVGHLVRLVDDLLDVSRVTRGLVQLQFGPVDLRLVVATAVEQARPLMEVRRHELVIRVGDEPVVVSGDLHRLVQVVSNLLNNAAKYTPPGGVIQIGLGCQDGRAQLFVADNGQGIPPHLIAHVFELFTQAERTPDRSQGGLGIGLALVRSLVKLHGGQVRAESPGAGMGSTFHVELPLSHDALAPSVADQRENGRSNRKILVVDDNVDAAGTLADVLELAGHTVAVEHDGSSALMRASAEEHWDTFILDIGLPDMTGYQLAGHLQRSAQAHGAIFIALTGYGQAHDRATSRAAGFDHHLVKPADIGQLIGILSGTDLSR